MTRINLLQDAPAAYQAMRGLETYLQGTQLSKTEIELIKLRASQLNACAYCLNMHTRDALKNGETMQRISVLPAWRESQLFTPSERALLDLTESVTLIHQGGVSDAVYQEAENQFGAEKLAQIIMGIVTINAWNRIAITSQIPVGPESFE